MCVVVHRSKNRTDRRDFIQDLLDITWCMLTVSHEVRVTFNHHVFHSCEESDVIRMWSAVAVHDTKTSHLSKILDFLLFQYAGRAISWYHLWCIQSSVHSSKTYISNLGMRYLMRVLSSQAVDTDDPPSFSIHPAEANLCACTHTWCTTLVQEPPRGCNSKNTYKLALYVGSIFFQRQCHNDEKYYISM